MYCKYYNMHWIAFRLGIIILNNIFSMSACLESSKSAKYKPRYDDLELRITKGSP